MLVKYESATGIIPFKKIIQSRLPLQTNLSKYPNSVKYIALEMLQVL